MGVIMNNPLDTQGSEQIASTQAVPATSLVSIVIPTFDRPDELRLCLQSLLAEVKTSRVKAEVIVVDNHPQTGLTPPVMKEFPEITFVSEVRQGLSNARNAGVRASKGDIIAFIDDDIFPQSGWLDAIIAPFANSRVMAVTGRVLPYMQQTEAERMFEQHVSFDKGDALREFGTEWYRSFNIRSVPAHYVGGGGNAAIRRSAFDDPAIGMFNPVLGAGTPVGAAEDKYIFYRILRSGYSIVYSPGASVLHKHRTTTSALYKQIHAYARAEIGYELECLVNDRDWRAATQLLIVLPVWTMRQLLSLVSDGRHAGADQTSKRVVLSADIKGYLAGFPAWLKSRRMGSQGKSPAT
jgi:O-antigen biosynthesis protein